jgi:hypothetical protein
MDQIINILFEELARFASFFKKLFIDELNMFWNFQ